MLKNAVRRSANKLGFDIHRISKPFFPIRMEISPLLQGHVNGAVLYADRTTALELFPRGGVVAEIGVALGDFTELMLAKLKPSRLDAFDLFRLHESGYQGRSGMDLFDGLSHRAYYERRFANKIATGHLHLCEGDSSVAMKKQPDSTYDIIYIDGDHSYEGVARDTEVSIRKLKENGVLVFNDYIICDHVAGVAYGVVPVVNDLCVNHGWKVLFFALQRQLFCDIGLYRN